ncbi:MAG: hypothetical protein MHMPM18_000227 [Marteilia pararefringens]
MSSITMQINVAKFKQRFFEQDRLDATKKLLDSALKTIHIVKDECIPPQKYPKTADDTKECLNYLDWLLVPLFYPNHDQIDAGLYRKSIGKYLSEEKLLQTIKKLTKWIEELEVIKETKKMEGRKLNLLQEKSVEKKLKDLRTVLKGCLDSKELLQQVTNCYDVWIANDDSSQPQKKSSATVDKGLEAFKERFFKQDRLNARKALLDSALKTIYRVKDECILPQKYPKTADDTKECLNYLEWLLVPLFYPNQDHVDGGLYRNSLGIYYYGEQISQILEKLTRWIEELEEIMETKKMEGRELNSLQEETVEKNLKDLRTVYIACKDSEELVDSFVIDYDLFWVDDPKMDLEAFIKKYFRDSKREKFKTDLENAISECIALGSNNYCEPQSEPETRFIILFSLKSLKPLMELFDDYELDRMDAKVFEDFFTKLSEKIDLYGKIDLQDAWIDEMAKESREEHSVSLDNNEENKFQKTHEKLKELRDCIDDLGEKMKFLFQKFTEIGEESESITDSDSSDSSDN